MSKPTYRVSYNFDSSCLFDTNIVFDSASESIAPRHVEQLVDEVAAGGADVVLICAGDQRTVYPSDVWQTYWDGFEEGDVSFFGDLPPEHHERRNRLLKQMKRLAEQCDYMETALTRCRERGIAPGITVRMNDVHDVPWPDSPQFSRFYKENPQFRLQLIDARDWCGQGLDYEYPEVRQHYLALIGELIARYDFDVLELDFMRFSFYFNRDDVDQHCHTMNGFIGEVRRLLNATGRTIHLIPRIASSPGAARQLGFDVQAWAWEGLVDGITAASFMGTCWNMPIAAFRDLVGPDVAIYAATECTADRRDGLPERYLPTSYEMLRGFAAGYLAAGADGVALFNYFLVRHHESVGAEQFYGALTEMRSLEEARQKKRTHVLDAGYWTVECDMPEQVPVTLRTNKSRRFEMILAAEPEGADVTVHVVFDSEATIQSDWLWLRVNLDAAGHAVSIGEGPHDKRKSKVAVFKVPAGAVRDAKNELVVRSENESITILGMDVHIS